MTDSATQPQALVAGDHLPSNGGLRRTRTTWAAYLVLGLFAYLETAIGPSMPFLRDKLDLDFTMASVHFSTFAAGVIAAGIWGDRVLRRSGRRIGLWGGMFGMVCGAVLLALSPSVAGTLPGVFIMGSIGTLALVSNQAILSDLHPAQRTVALTESNVAASSAAIMAPLAVGGFAKFGPGWQTALLVGIPVLALLAWRFWDAPVPAPPRQIKTQTQRPRLPAIFWILFAVLFLAMSVEWCVAYWGADFLNEEAGLERATAATAMSIFFGAMIAGRILGSRLARKRKSIWLLIGCIAIALIGFPFFWLGQSSWVNLAGLFVAGIGIANFYPLIVGTATTTVPDAVERAASRLAISGGSALLLMPLVVGAISDAVGMRWGLGIVVPLLLSALALSLLVERSLRIPVPGR
jgi:fucose permease